MSKLRLIFYAPDSPPGPVEKEELTQLPPRARGELKATMKILRDRGTAELRVCRSTGPVLCVETQSEQRSVHMFYAQLQSRSELVVLHVASTSGDCSADGYRLAQARRDDVSE